MTTVQHYTETSAAMKQVWGQAGKSNQQGNHGISKRCSQVQAYLSGGSGKGW